MHHRFHLSLQRPMGEPSNLTSDPAYNRRRQLTAHRVDENARQLGQGEAMLKTCQQWSKAMLRFMGNEVGRARQDGHFTSKNAARERPPGRLYDDALCVLQHQ